MCRIYSTFFLFCFWDSPKDYCTVKNESPNFFSPSLHHAFDSFESVWNFYSLPNDMLENFRPPPLSDSSEIFLSLPLLVIFGLFKNWYLCNVKICILYLNWKKHVIFGWFSKKNWTFPDFSVAHFLWLLNYRRVWVLSCLLLHDLSTRLLIKVLLIRNNECTYFSKIMHFHRFCPKSNFIWYNHLQLNEYPLQYISYSWHIIYCKVIKYILYVNFWNISIQRTISSTVQ